MVIPAGWPKNELIGCSVIVPPAKERTGQANSFDWWFCHKLLEKRFVQ